MKNLKIVAFIYIIILFSCTSVFGQNVDSRALLDSVRIKLDKISDYAADIEIEVDVEFINMPPKHARIYYKKPDKVKFTSEEFIMLPKQGMQNPIQEILKEPYTAIFLRTDTINENTCHVIRIVPLAENPEILLLTVWIDTRLDRLLRSQSNTSNNGSFQIDFEYDENTFELPAKMTFTFEVENMNLPLKFIGKSSGIQTNENQQNGPAEGKVYIHFRNYLINQDIPDAFFDDTERNN